MRIKRADKLARVCRYLTGATGMTGIRYEASDNTIYLPYPHAGRLVTDRRQQRLFDYLKAAPDSKMNVVIKYDGDNPTVDETPVVMTLRTYSILLACYHEVKGDRDAAHASKR
jgi:hypothetical protein